MGRRKMILFDTHFNLRNGEPVHQLLYRNMVFFVNSCCSFFCNYVFHLFKIIPGFVFRFQMENHDSNSHVIDQQKEDDEIVLADNESGCCNLASPKAEVDVLLGEREKEASGFSFKFELKSAEHIRRNVEDPDFFSESASKMNVRKYSFLSEKDVIGFVREPEAAASFSIEESYVDLKLKGSCFGDDKIALHQFNSVTEQDKSEAFIDLEIKSVVGKRDVLELDDVLFEKNPESIQFSGGSSEEDQIMNLELEGYDQYELLPANDFRGFNYEQDSTNDRKIRGGYLEEDRKPEEEANQRMSETLDYSVDEYKLYASDTTELGEDSSTDGSSAVNEMEMELELEDDEIENLPEDDDDDDFDFFFDNELERYKSGIGLPTIYEESESSETVDDLITPWNIEEKLVQEDPMDELRKFHKSYAERMRKLDILNYQKMHAIGLLQLKKKGPLRYFTSGKKSDADSLAKLISEVESDLEMVYVGQSCLSWEFLHWQYLKALELLKSDCHQYNRVAGEFQQLQVLLQRFLENEPFLREPRVQNYVQNRCVFRKLLQVPPIKEDSLKERIGRNDAITSGMLVHTIEKAMSTLWEFIKADKDEATVILKGVFFGTPADQLQDAADSELFKKVQADFHKKEKKLRDLLRTGNCLVKRFQRHQENKSDLVLFFSQVDMKLVSRVLKMSRISSDQLVWCHKKLSMITFTNRKIHREPSFFLFPC